jgi:hypothetical protein
MSEFVEIIVKDTEIGDAPLNVWKEALELLGYKLEVAPSEAMLLPLFGFQNDMRTQKVLLRIHRSQLKSMSNDAGVYQTKEGKLQLYLSKYDMDGHSVVNGVLTTIRGNTVPKDMCSRSLQKLFFELPEKIKEVGFKHWKEQAAKEVTKAIKKLGYSKFTMVTDKTLKCIKL